MIGDRLTEFRTRAGLTVDEFVELLGITKGTYYSYLPREARKANDPPWSAVVEWSRRTMASLDWLGGMNVPMWSRAQLEPYVEELQRLVLTNPPTSRIFRERVCTVIRIIHTLDTARFTPLLIATVLSLKRTTVEAILTGEDQVVPEEVTTQIQARFGISENWLRMMDGGIIR